MQFPFNIRMVLDWVSARIWERSHVIGPMTNYLTQLCTHRQSYFIANVVNIRHISRWSCYSWDQRPRVHNPLCNSLHPQGLTSAPGFRMRQHNHGGYRCPTKLLLKNVFNCKTFRAGSIRETRGVARLVNGQNVWRALVRHQDIERTKTIKAFVFCQKKMWNS